MTSTQVSMLFTDLGVSRPHCRPHVSNDIPYSEAGNRTLKYLPDFLDHFASLEHVKQLRTESCTSTCIFQGHSGIGLHAPASVHFGTSDAIDVARRATSPRITT